MVAIICDVTTDRRQIYGQTLDKQATDKEWAIIGWLFVPPVLPSFNHKMHNVFLCWFHHMSWLGHVIGVWNFVPLVYWNTGALEPYLADLPKLEVRYDTLLSLKLVTLHS